MTWLFLLTISSSLLLIALAVPLIRQKVKPNIWYGFRIPKTLSDPAIWYPANRTAGTALLIAGTVMTASITALYAMHRWTTILAPLSDDTLALLILGVTVIPLTAVVITSVIHVHRL